MNWDDIRYFLALCREGSVSQAGKALGVNHTTVARRITALEHKLGTRLFDRTRDGYAMTQAAENSGKIVTTAGVTAGIDGALRLREPDHCAGVAEVSQAVPLHRARPADDDRARRSRGA